MISVWFAHERASGGCPGKTVQMRTPVQTVAGGFPGEHYADA